MIIGIDIGNTHIVTGIYDDKGELISTFRLATNDKMTEDEYDANLSLKGLYTLYMVNYSHL